MLVRMDFGRKRGGNFLKLHNLNLTCKKALISTDSHSMAAYIFLWWVLIVIYSSQIYIFFHEIMQLPTLRNSHFVRTLTVCSVYARRTMRKSCVVFACYRFAVKIRWQRIHASCILHACECIRVRTATDNTVRKRSKREILRVNRVYKYVFLDSQGQVSIHL